MLQFMYLCTRNFFDMRLHRNLCFTVIDSIKLIFNEEEYADKVVQKALKRDARWGARDRKFIAETIYEMVRWKRLYNEIAGTKNHYTSENVWKNFAVFAILKGYKLPDWNQLQGVPERRIKDKFDELQKIRVFKESIPDWMDELAVKELGEKHWTKEIEALNMQAEVILRTNTLRTNKLSLQKKLADEGIETEFIENENLVSDSVSLENSRIIEPCYIGANVVLKNSTIGPNVSLGEGSVVEDSIISNSLIQSNTTVKNAQLNEAMIGNHAYFDGKFDSVSIGDYSVLM